jgi:hypothetical protein
MHKKIVWGCQQIVFGVKTLGSKTMGGKQHIFTYRMNLALIYTGVIRWSCILHEVAKCEYNFSVFNDQPPNMLGKNKLLASKFRIK